MCRVDHLRVRRSHRANSRKRFSHSPRSAQRTKLLYIVVGGPYSAGNRTAALENMHDPADDATIINPLDTANWKRGEKKQAVGRRAEGATRRFMHSQMPKGLSNDRISKIGLRWWNQDANMRGYCYQDTS